MIDVICACLNDYELCSITLAAIEDKFGYDRIMDGKIAIPHELKVIFYVESCDGFARCNGFDSLLCMYCDHPFLEMAYREIGQKNQSEILGSILQAFPKKDRYPDYHLPFIDWPSCEEYLSEHPNFRRWIEEFDERSFEISQEKVEQNLSRYIRIHRKLLEPLLDNFVAQDSFKLVEQRK